MDAADTIVTSYCCYALSAPGAADECGLSKFAEWSTADISKLISALDGELQRREHAKNV
jgi:hypothetical protein